MNKYNEEQNIKEQAEQGYADAQFALGVMYEEGEGVEQSHEKAFAWCKKAAEQGLAEAQFAVGFMYQQGEGVEQSDEQAFAWCKQAADQEHAHAQCSLGLMYAQGGGVKQSYKKALKWYKKAAEQGHMIAQCSLGFMYGYGIGVEQSDEEAFAWHKQAAEQGHADSQYNMGFMYAQGREVEQSDEQAFAWYQKAAEQYKKTAEQGDAEAQFSLGMMYELGEGVEQSYKDAIEYYKQSFNDANIMEMVKFMEIKLPALAAIAYKVHIILNTQRVMPEDKIPPLVHYTSLDTLRKIMPAEPDEENNSFESKPLRLQNIDASNDPDEGKVLFKILNIQEQESSLSYPLITCFCEKPLEILPMWYLYADNAMGVALSVRTKSVLPHGSKGKDVFTALLDSDVSSAPSLPQLYRVLYIKDTWTPALQALAKGEAVEEDENTAHGNPQEKDQDDTIPPALQALANAIGQARKADESKIPHVSSLLIELAHIVKYADYEYEQEIRLVRFAFKSDIQAKDKDERLKVCLNSNRIYTDELKNMEYTKITCAPRMNDTEYRYVKYLGDARDIPVRRSRIHFRGDTTIQR